MSTITLPVVTVSDTSATEGGTLRFAVTLSHAPTSDVTVKCSLASLGPTDADYKGEERYILTFKAGETVKYIDLPTYADGFVEPDETLLLVVVSAQGATVEPHTVGTGTIKDNNKPTLTGTNGPDFLRGSSDNDLIDGRGGADLIEGDPGDDRMTGGGGADVFIFVRKHGHDVITDFNPAEGDNIRFSSVGFSSFDQLLEHAEQDGEDVVIHTSPGDQAHSLTLLEVQLDELDAAQFSIFGGPRSSLTAALATPQAAARLSSPAPAFSLGDGAVGGHHAAPDEYGIEEMLGSYYDNYFEII